MLLPRHIAPRATAAAILLLAACSSSPAPSPSPAPTKAPEIVVTIFSPTPTAAPSAAAPAQTPTQGSAPKTVAAPTTLPANVNPFTGLELKDAAINRRPLLIKIANTPDVRPQSGLSGADVVFEHYSEGGITRFTALYLANDVNKIGSVRSCRLIDIELPAMLDASLVCSGTSPGVKPLMRDSWGFKNNVTMISDFGPFECAECPMFRTSDAPVPHNLFANTANARKELDARKKNTRTAFNSWTFDANAPGRGKEVSELGIPYTSGTVSWSYDKTSGKWGRALAGQPQIDKLTGKQLGVDNVLVIFAPHVETLIQEDVTGSRSIEIQFWKSGYFKLARDGRLLEGNWKRSESTANLVLSDLEGKPLPLKPGTTWVQLVPVDFRETSR
jgi:hypothetical protein